LLTKNSVSNSVQVLSLWEAGKFTLVISSPQILYELVVKLIDSAAHVRLARVAD